MKKLLLVLLFALLAATAFAKTKASVIAGSNIVETTESNDVPVQFGGAYTGLNITAEDDYITGSGKFYYRLNAADQWEKNSQKLDVKKAVLKIRPFGTDILEISVGKLYSYYLPGTFFQLSEIYTGSGRWGKTGVGLSFNKSGFFGGLGIPLTESYVKFSDSFGLSTAFGYDFKKVNKSIPVKLGTDLIYSMEKQKDESYKNDFSSTVSVLYTPSINGFISKVSVAASFSYNAEPFVASSVFKNVSNYKNTDLKKSNFGSLNTSANLGKIQLSLEGEAGHSTKGSLIPLYVGTQVVVPITEKIALRPRFFYYAVLDSQNKDDGRQTFEIYPRIWITTGNFVISAGYDFDFKQTTSADYDFKWSIPVSIEYKVAK